MSLILMVYIIVRRLGVPPDRTAQARRLCYDPLELMTRTTSVPCHK